MKLPRGGIPGGFVNTSSLANSLAKVDSVGVVDIETYDLEGIANVEEAVVVVVVGVLSPGTWLLC